MGCFTAEPAEHAENFLTFCSPGSRRLTVLEPRATVVTTYQVRETAETPAGAAGRRATTAGTRVGQAPPRVDAGGRRSRWSRSCRRGATAAAGAVPTAPAFGFLPPRHRPAGCGRG